MKNEVSINLGKIIEELPSDMKRCMANACKTVQTHARKNAPKDTGNLRRSIDFTVDDDGTEGTIYVGADYAPYVEYGTGIYATKGGGRQTPWAYEGSQGWATIKGTKAQPFLEPALNQSRSDILDAFKGVFD